MAESDSEIGQGLLYEDFLPLQWLEVEEPSAFLKTSRFNENNEDVLRFIGVLDESSNELDEDYSPIAQELMRFETKLNLLLGLVGQLLTVHFPLPPLKAVKLNPVGIEWITELGPRPGDFGIVEIYLNSSCPRALTFPGKVEGVEVAGNGNRIRVQFMALSESIRERLEKIIFRHHRRRVAMARRRLIPESDKMS